MARFKDKVIVVTGASRGIGQAICVAFGREQATVVGVACSDLVGTRDKVQTAGGKFVAIKADLSAGTQKEAKDLITEILQQTGKIDGLINNAGIIRRAPAVDFSEADWNDVLRVNLSAPFFLAQAVAKWWFDIGKDKATADTR